jgi:pyrroline-5-carboxylate reductase
MSSEILSSNPTTLLIGCGNMGRALLDGWLAAGVLSPDAVTIVDPAASAPDGVHLVDDIPEGIAPDLIVLAIKPQQFAELAPRLRSTAEGALVLSILAGTGTAQLSQALPGARVARIMANLAAAFGQSPVALYAQPGAITPSDRALLERMGAALGPSSWLDDERLLHAVTALGGSGPGFVYRLLQAFARAGAAELAQRSGESFADLAARVASPGGTTEAGLAELERDHAADRLVTVALRAARDRSKDLAEGG